jgi:hypothetical protein
VTLVENVAGVISAERSGRGPFIQTYTGKKFYPFDPRPEEVCLADIAHSLSTQCRFGGHSTSFYSVAQHSVLVSLQVNHLWGLLHDATEAYILDWPKPLKRYLFVGRFRTPHKYWGMETVETQIASAIAERFGLTLPIPRDVHQADMSLLLTERRDLMVPTGEVWEISGDPLTFKIVPWTWIEAEDQFLRAAEAFGIKD